MHDINYFHEHEITEHDFLGCCQDCKTSLNIIKPHIISFASRIKKYTLEMLKELPPDDLYRLYQVLDDLTHMNAGVHLSGLLLEEPEIQKELPDIRSYYTNFFSIHEIHLAKSLLNGRVPWKTLESFPLYPRYLALVKNQIEAMNVRPGTRIAFLGSGPVPISLILMSRFYNICSVGLDNNPETVELSQKVIHRLGLDKSIEIICGDDSHLKHLKWDTVLVAALSEPKKRIFQNLHEILKQKKQTPVIFRTYTGMKAVLYKPVQPEDIKGFKIVNVIPPTGRINNTIVFLNLKKIPIRHEKY